MPAMKDSQDLTPMDTLRCAQEVMSGQRMSTWSRLRCGAVAVWRGCGVARLRCGTYTVCGWWRLAVDGR
jgi:predicted RNA-binding Zn-ribbon protein involved in translation (DUF1610 family)